MFFWYAIMTQLIDFLALAKAETSDARRAGSTGWGWYRCWRVIDSSSFNMNRRMRNRTYGGVRGRRE